MNPLDSMPYKELTKPEGRPTPLEMATIWQQLYANATSVFTNLSALFGFLYLLIFTAAEYATLTGEVFVEPVHPGDNPNIPQQNPTQHQLLEAQRLHQHQLNTYNLYAMVNTILKAMIMRAFDEIYYHDLKHAQTHYSQVTARQLWKHLMDNYGKLSRDDLDKNEQAMNKEWTTAQPLEQLWKQMDTAKAIAGTQEPISDTTMIRVSIKNLRNVPEFKSGLAKFNELDDAQQTWAQLKTIMNKADKSRLLDLSTQDAGYHSANKVEEQPKENKENTSPTGTALFYCWTHGLGRNPNHTSSTCKNPAANHNKKATADNMMGGNNKITRKRTEKAIYKPPQQPDQQPGE